MHIMYNIYNKYIGNTLISLQFYRKMLLKIHNMWLPESLQGM